MKVDNNLFNKAVESIVKGDAESLKKLLKKNPALVTARSTADHQATLLHYLSANGVEEKYQKTPSNAVEIGKILLDAGAEVDAIAGMYGGGAHQTTLNNLVSSWWPFKAGVQSDLIHLLVHYGANVNGIEDDGSPLGVAISFGYKEAAETLANLGADINNVIFASALGKKELVASFFYPDGNLKPSASNYKVTDKKETGRYSWPPPESADPLAVAFVLSCVHGRNEIIQMLLEKGIDVNSAITRRQTGLHYAAQLGYIDTAKLLLDNGADPCQVETQFNKTPFDWAADSHEYGVIKVLNLYVSEENVKQFSHAAPIFPVADVKKSANFYRDLLGFNITFILGKPASYAVLKREDIRIHLCIKEDDFKPSSVHKAFYIFVYDVDGLYNEFVNKGVEISNPIANREYGMRDFDIKDPNGYLLTFGCQI